MKKSYKIVLLVFAATILLIVGFMGYGLYLMAEDDMQANPADLLVEMQDGDIIFQTSLSAQSKAIQLATHSQYSHVGIIYKNGDDWYVYEAVQPVKQTPLDKWVARGDGKHYVIKRLKNSETVLTAATIKKMQEVGKKYKDKNYDSFFEWSDDKIYCSELVWKVYKEGAGIEVGKLQTLEEFDLTSPIVQKKMKERFGDNIPKNEVVISPAAIFDSELLTTVYEN